MSVSLIAISLAACIGCHSIPPQRRGQVSSELHQRFGSQLSVPRPSGQILIPPDVALEDGVSEDEATQIALWNNAAFLDLLADLGISRAQLLDAGLIADPQLVLFFPLGPKQLEFTVFETVNSVWLRHVRVRAATLDLNQVAQSMVQNGLNTIRDVRVAHADLVQAQQQANVARDAESIRAEIAELAQRRLDAGDISELELNASQIDALQARADAARAMGDVQLAQHRLRTLLGLSMLDAPIVAVSNRGVDVSTDDQEQLLATALALRPDLRAAEIAIEAMCQRLGLAKRQFTTADAIYDANGEGFEGFESGPGLRLTLPIFNRNRGGISIAHARWQKSARQYVTVRDQITLDVRTAHTQLLQAQQNLELLRNDILPALDEAQRLAQRNYESGGTDYFLVLQTTGPYLDARMRESLLLADVHRATAELERSVGTRLTASDPELPAPAEMIVANSDQYAGPPGN